MQYKQYNKQDNLQKTKLKPLLDYLSLAFALLGIANPLNKNSVTL
jgi:hypothetical protein